MTFKVLSPDSKQLTLICGLGWPEVCRYYLSNREGDLWEFWEQPPGSGQARLVFGWLADGAPSENDVAKRLLCDYLGTFKPERMPVGETVQGLLSIREIRRILRKHKDRGESRLLEFPVQPTSSGQPAA